MVKPWWHRTELWVTVLTSLTAVGAAIGELLPARYAALVAAVVAAGYNISRGLAKTEHVPTPPAPPAEPNP
jgi:hypothetical protein